MSSTELRPGARRGRGPSQADVAAHARVSGQTVSRVANGMSNVDPETRERVLASMKALGYRPNRAARALRSGRFHSIGLIVFRLDSYGNMRTVDAISAAAAAAGYSITLVSAAAPTRDAVLAAFDEFLGLPVDGIVLLNEAVLQDVAMADIPPGLPVVVIDSVPRPDHPVVDTDQADGARLATEHLLELGHRTVHHVAGPPDSYSAGQRAGAWRAALERAGRPVVEPIQGDWTSDSGYRSGLRLADDPSVTAVFASNDQMALGILRALHERKIPVPRRVSVVGFDDSPDSSSFWPPLTTVHQDFASVGARTVETLLGEIAHGHTGSGVSLVPTRLVVRMSTARP